MDQVLLRNIILWGSILILVVIHVLVYLYGTTGKRRGQRAAAAHLGAFDWALLMGVTAGWTVAREGTSFWSLYTMAWGVGGVLLLFVPAWLLFQLGLRRSGRLLLPVRPTDRKQCDQAGHALRAYAWNRNYAFYREEDGELRKLVESSVGPRGPIVGKAGPGLVIASSHYAIPLTMGTRDTQVGGYGIVFTGHWEHPRGLVDLRPQARIRVVHALTRDSIPVKVSVTAVFQIDRRRAKSDGLYPFDSKTVFAAVQAQGIGPDQEGKPEELGWERIVIDRAAALVRDAIARTLLDRLLENDQEGEKPPREALRDIVKGELAQAMKPHGIQVMGIGLGNIEVEDEEVRQQRAESWKAVWERRRLEIEAQGEAEAIRLIEEAHTDAQRQMIATITKAFEQLVDAGTPVPAHVIALRFIDVLEDVATSHPVQELLPESAQTLPTQLRRLVAPSTTGEQSAQQPKGST